ncbi:MAG: cyclic nucleotide-binding domain-containing protein [Myxococcales bacterium]|nr:cyclic nucleotide-binding domain-containing protein [Myxococcales bacterium]
MARPGLTRESLRQAGLAWILESTFICQLDLHEQEQLLASMEWRDYPRDRVIIEDGVPGPGVDLIIEGQAILLLRGSDGKLAAHARMGPGQVVGERSLHRGVPTVGQIKAISPVRSLHLSPAPFRALLAGSERLRAFVENLVSLREQGATILELLLRNPFFRLLSRDDLEQFIQSGAIDRVPAGRRVVTAGERSSEVFLLVRGRVAVYAPGGQGASRELLATETAGWLFGHAAALLELPRTADVDTIEATEFLVVQATAFMAIVSQNPSLQRRLFQQLATMDLRAAAARSLTAGTMLVSVYGARPGVGTTTIAYGMAAELATTAPVALVDLAGPATARRLGMSVREEHEGDVPVLSLGVPAAWPFRVVWPRDPGHTLTLLRHLRATVSGAVLVAAQSRDPIDRDAMAECEAVVFVRPGSDVTHAEAARRGQFRVEAVRIDGDSESSLQVGRNAVRVPPDPAAAARFWRSGDLASLRDETCAMGRACRRLVRVLQGRSVGLALGGGGALGFAHVGLIRALRKAGIPIDYVAGSSFGALAAGAYAIGGEAALDRLVEERRRILPWLAAGVIHTRAIAMLVDRLFGRVALSSTEIPFFPVAMDLLTGREVVLSRGTVGEGVRSSSCLPGPFPAWSLGPWRLVDGGIINNVPASVTWEAGANFIVASNIIPSSPGINSARGGPGIRERLRQAALSRLDDLVRSMYLMMSQIGRDRASLADYLFDLDLAGYTIYDFAQGDVIADAGQRQAEAQIEEIVSAYRSDTSARIQRR